MYIWACVTLFDTNTMERCCGQYSVTNCRCDVSAFDLQRSMCWPSKIDNRCVDFQRSTIDVSTFEDRCVDFRRSMCRPSEIAVSTFEDQWSMCRPSKIDDWCVDLRTSMVDVKLCCYPCSKHWYYSCMRITPRVCTSVLSFCIASIHCTGYIGHGIMRHCVVLNELIMSVHCTWAWDQIDFSMENEKRAAQVGFEPTMHCLWGRCSTNWVTMATQLAGPIKAIQDKVK